MRNHSDPLKAIPFHSSVRIRLSSGTQVKDSKGNIIGIHVIMTTKKNKVGPPFRKYEFDIIFGKGIVEHEYIFDEVRSHCEKNKVFYEDRSEKTPRKLSININGSSAWKQLLVTDVQTGEIVVDKKFYKNDFDKVMSDPQLKPYVDKVIEATYTIELGTLSRGEGESPDSDDVAAQ